MSEKQKPMTINEIIGAVAEATDQTKKDVKAILETYQDILINELYTKNEVKLGNIGKMKIKVRAAREGVNPATNEKIVIEAKAVPKFLFSKAIKDEVVEKFSK